MVARKKNGLIFEKRQGGRYLVKNNMFLRKNNVIFKIRTPCDFDEKMCEL